MVKPIHPFLLGKKKGDKYNGIRFAPDRPPWPLPSASYSDKSPLPPSLCLGKLGIVQSPNHSDRPVDEGSQENFTAFLELGQQVSFERSGTLLQEQTQLRIEP